MSDSGEQAAVRMEPLATLPVFFKLRGKRAVMAGGDNAAAWKVELLAAAGASVDVYALDPSDELLALAAVPPSGAVSVIRRMWQADDLAGAAVAIGALENEAEAADFRDAARRQGVPVNVIDKPAFCDFQFGTIVARSPLLIGISTDGGAPVFGQALRARVEALLPQGLRGWAQAAKDWRPALQARALDFRARRSFWEAFTARALVAGDEQPTEQDKAACLAASVGNAAASAGVVTFVGCGPGAPDFLTFQAARVLQSADLVIHDADVPAATIAMARREAAKRPNTGSNDQQITDLASASASSGRHVAWLGTGNPASCKRWAARADLFRRTRPHPSLVPGLSVCPQCFDRCDGAPRELSNRSEAVIATREP